MFSFTKCQQIVAEVVTGSPSVFQVKQGMDCYNLEGRLVQILPIFTSYHSRQSGTCYFIIFQKFNKTEVRQWGLADKLKFIETDKNATT